MIQFTCPHCQARLSVSDDKAGQSRKCLKCGRTIQVPLAGAVKGRASLKPPARGIERVGEGAIPIAEPRPDKAAEPARLQRPRPATGGLGIPPARAMDRTMEEEIPLTEEPRDNAKAASIEQERLAIEPEPPATEGGLIVTTDGDAVVVCIQRDKILDSLTIEAIGRELYALVEERGCRKMVLDFGRVEFLSSQMLGVLMVLHKKIAGINGRLVLCAVRNDLQKVFKIVRLDKVLPIVADREAAMGELR